MSKIEKKDKRIRKKSSCWLFYTKHDKGGICRLCQKKIISHGNTTNLLNHLKRKHRIQWEAATEDNEEDSIETHMELQDDEDQEDESIELHRSTKEAHDQGLAYQSSDGRTVIWLHPDVQLDQLSSALQPQIAFVEQATSSDNAEETTAEVSENKDGTGILGELEQKDEDTTSSDEVVQKADTTDESHSLVTYAMVLNDGEVIQQDDTNIDNVAQIVTVSSSEDPSTEDNPVSSSPSNIVLDNLVTSGASNTMLDNLKTNPSRIQLGNITTSPSNITMGKSTPVKPQRTVVVTRTFKTRPIQPKPQWIPNQMVGQTLINNINQNKSSVQSSVSILKNNSGQNSEDNCVEQSPESCGGLKHTEGWGKPKKSKKVRHRGTQREEDAFDHFGKYIAALLRKLPSKRSASRLQREMLNSVLKEQILYDD